MEMKVLKSVLKLTLKSPMTIEELYELMTKSTDVPFPRTFKLKKGLLGKSIEFDAFLETAPTITVKDDTVTLRKVEKSTSVGGVDIKTMKQSIGNLAKGDFSNGFDYFENVYTALQELLKDRIR